MILNFLSFGTDDRDTRVSRSRPIAPYRGNRLEKYDFKKIEFKVFHTGISIFSREAHG